MAILRLHVVKRELRILASSASPPQVLAYVLNLWRSEGEEMRGSLSPGGRGRGREIGINPTSPAARPGGRLRWRW